jgi:hypothetical protein
MATEVEIMATLSGRALSVFKDACGVHEFSEEELGRIEAITDQLEQVLKASKDRQQRAMMARGQMRQLG